MPNSLPKPPETPQNVKEKEAEKGKITQRNETIKITNKQNRNSKKGQVAKIYLFFAILAKAKAR